jgi:hypothetical protein
MIKPMFIYVCLQRIKAFANIPRAEFIRDGVVHDGETKPQVVHTSHGRTTLRIHWEHEFTVDEIPASALVLLVGHGLRGLTLVL